MTERDSPVMTMEASRRPFIRRAFGGMRARILISYVALLVIAAAVSVFAVRQILLVRLDARIQEDLEQEVQEFRSLANGTNPTTGEPFGADVNAIFDLYLERNVPDDDEELITVPRRGKVLIDGGDNATAFSFGDFIEAWRTLDSTERDAIDTPSGEVQYVATPVQAGSKTLGTFVVASFVADERDEVNEAVLIVTAVSVGVLLFGGVLAFLATGRVLAPLRELTTAVRAVSGTELNRRIKIEGDDEVAQLGRSFNRMLDRLEIAFSTQREFIRDVSHELRTPIAISGGHLELLSEGHITEPDAQREAIALVTGELDRMSRFVDDLLLLAKAESPNFLELETVALDELCEELVAKARGMADRDWRLDASSRHLIVADRQRITQAVLNLAQNSIAHSDLGDEIAIGAEIRGTEAAIWVRDTGVGIPKSEQTRIFQRFSRGLHSRGRYEGTGIGLAIVRAISEAHGGHVRVESTPGQGSRFELLIPVDQDDLRETWSREVRA